MQIGTWVYWENRHLKRSNLQYQKPGSDPNQNDQNYDHYCYKTKTENHGIVIILQIVKILIMPIVDADPFLVNDASKKIVWNT